MKGVTADDKTVTVMEIYINSSEFQDSNGNGHLGEKYILKKNKTAGNNFDSNGTIFKLFLAHVRL